MEISKYVRLIVKSPKKTFRSLWGAQYRQSASQAVIQINDDIWDARNCRDFFIVVQRLLYILDWVQLKRMASIGSRLGVEAVVELKDSGTP